MIRIPKASFLSSNVLFEKINEYNFETKLYWKFIVFGLYLILESYAYYYQQWVNFDYEKKLKLGTKIIFLYEKIL